MMTANPSRLRRLRQMDASELRFRATVALRNAMDRARASVSTPAWDRGALVLTGPALEPVRRLLASRDWIGAHRGLARHFAERDRRFPVDANRSAQIAASVRHRFPDLDARSRADRILAGRYDLLGYPDVTLGQAPDWHRDPVHDRRAPLLFWDAVPYLDPACGDHKITWEFNRHQHFLVLGRAYHLTGDRRYYREFVRQVEAWIAANPPLVGINWASMLELAFRSLSWLWALHFFAGAAGEGDDYPWLVDLLLALDRQLVHVEHNLSRYFSPNTHLSGEALALYVAGRALPELGNAGQRAGVGRSVLIHEATAQINRDGGHAERSAHYHRYSTDFYLLALNIARLTEDSAAKAFDEAARRQAAFLRTIATDAGQLPLIGDDDGGQLFPICGRAPADCADSLAHAAVLLDDASLSVGTAPEETYWFCGVDYIEVLPTAPMPWPSRQFPETGYCVSRTDRGDHLVFDCGKHGFLNGGHAHADALSVVLSVGGRPLLVDPGTATYTMDPALRDRFRGTAMHNTLVVNGRPQSAPRGAFHWASTTDAECTSWSARAGIDYAEGRHGGYEGVTHVRRVVALHGVGWLIVDRVAGRPGPITASAFWHVHPDWTVFQEDPHRFSLRHHDGLELAIVSTAPLAEIDGPEACYAPVYGRVESAPCITATIEGAAPLTIATFVPAVTAWSPVAIRGTLEPDTFEVETTSGIFTLEGVAAPDSGGIRAAPKLTTKNLELKT